MTCLTGPFDSWHPATAWDGLAAATPTAVIPAILAGSKASASKRAIERPSAERNFMGPPSLIRIPSTRWRSSKTLWRSQMNVWLNLHADRCVLWQRNADGSRCRAAPTPLARTGGRGAIRGVRGIRRRLDLRPLHAAVRRPEWSLPGGVDPTGRPGRNHLKGPPRGAGNRHHLPPPVDPGQRGDHRRPHLQRPTRARPGGRLASAGARGAGDSLPAPEGAGRATGGGRAGHPPADDEGPCHLQGTALPAGRGELSPETHPETAPAHLDRCQRRAADVADRRPSGRRLACLRLRRFDGPQITAARPI